MGAATNSSSISDPVHTVIHAVKGQTVLHLACLHSMPRLLQHCLQMSQSPPQSVFFVLDAEGNTPLHCCAMSNQLNALDCIKLLLSFAAPASAITNEPTTTTSSISSSLVVAKNRMGQTAYDVAILNTVRQYLLPLQLQAETQAALDNGGVGLPPGIDLGGLKITNSQTFLPPPPICTPMMTAGGAGGGMSPQSVYPPTPGLYQQPQSVYPPPPGLLQQQQQQQPPSMYGSSTPPTPLQPTPSAPPTAAPAAAAGLPRPPSALAPSSNGSQHSYAHKGHSSAALFRSKSGIQPDGFHSSSSDKNLQEKYGHVSNTNNNAVVLPPPPSSGNFTAPESSLLTSVGSHSSPASLNGGGSAGANNPFAGGRSALGAGGCRATSNRYIAYDPFAGRSQPPHQTARPPVSGGNMALLTPSAAAPVQSNFTTFTPLAQQQQQQQQGGMLLPSAPDSYQPPPQGMAAASQIPDAASSFMPPPPGGAMFASPKLSFGTTPANTPAVIPRQAPVNDVVGLQQQQPGPFLPPPPYQSGAVSAATPSPVAGPMGFANATPSKSAVSNNAASVFGSATSPSSIQSSTPPLGVLRGKSYHRSISSPSNPSDLFSRPAVGQSAAATTSPASQTPPAAAPLSATELFGRCAAAPTAAADSHVSPPVAVDQQPKQVDSPSASEAAAVDTKEPPAFATDLLGDAGTAPNGADVAVATDGQSKNDAPVPLANHNTGEEDDLDDIPLTPGNEVLINNSALFGKSQVGAIGLPPPPFSRK